MFNKRLALLFILIFVFLLIFPGVIMAENMSAQGTASDTQQNNNIFRIEVSEDGFENADGKLPIVVEQGQEIEIIFVYADITSFNNKHIIQISGYNIETEVLGKDNPEVSVKFIANKTGEFSFKCILDCVGHKNIQTGVLVVQPAGGDGSQTAIKVTIALDAPDQSETGQPLTLTALVKDELNEPVAGVLIKFLIESNFFVNNMMDIGEVVTDEQGIVKIEYTPNQPGALHAVALYETGSGLEPVEVEKIIDIKDNGKFVYQSKVGIQFPNSLLFWMLAVFIVLAGVWSTFLYVLFQVNGISRIGGIKGLPIILMIVVAALFIMLALILTTPEAQFNFSLFP